MSHQLIKESEPKKDSKKESLISAMDNMKKSELVVYIEQIKELRQKLNKSKLFMNMVIHDLRNPSESIQ
jgi:hypothetical protein